MIACEDTRHTRKLLARHGIEPRGRLVSYHEHNERKRAAELVERVAGGRGGGARERRGDAGRVGPGQRAGRRVPSSGAGGRGAAGAVGAGRPRWPPRGCRAESWRFAGFLPRKKGELRARAAARRRDAGRVRVAAPAAARRWRCWPRSTRAAGRGLPRADQGARGGGARERGRAGEAVRRRARAERSCS